MRLLHRFAIGLIAVVAATPLALSPSAQEARKAPAAAVKTIAKGGRDLAMATPESVGISPERLHRLDAAMNRIVDAKQVSGLVTLLERHGKSSTSAPPESRTCGSPTRCRRTRSSASTR